MRIGELAERAGTSTRSLRYYEQQGLLAARRNASGHRDYDESDLRLVREIRGLLTIGFALEETRPFVECLRSGHRSGDSCPASVAVYRRKLAEVEEYLDRLGEVRDHLRDQLARVTNDPNNDEENSCTAPQPRPGPALGPGPAPGPALGQSPGRSGKTFVGLPTPAPVPAPTSVPTRASVPTPASAGMAQPARA